MALPVNEIAATVNNATGHLKKIAGKIDAQGFENCLGGKIQQNASVDNASLKEIIADLTGDDTEITDATLAGATELFQLLNTLNESGMNASDIQALLTGSGSGLSDSGLQALLTTLGVSSEQISTILENSDVTAGLKTQIAQSLQELAGLTEKTTDGGSSVLQEGLSVQEGDNPLSLVTKLTEIAGSDLTAEQQSALQAVQEGMRNLNAALGSPVSGTSQSGVLSALVEQVSQSDQMLASVLQEVKQALPEISFSDAKLKLKNLINQDALKNEANLQVKFDAGTSTAMTAQSDSETAAAGPSVEKTVQVLENELGVEGDDLQKIFFSTDADERQQAVEKLTGQLEAYLNEGKTIGKELKNALSTIRQATTSEEWSGIQNTLKLLQVDLQISGQKTALSESFMNQLAAKLGANTEGAYTDKTIDQIRFQLPSQLNNGQGSATIELNPPSLGKVEVNVVMEDGKLQATFRAESQIARDIIHSNMAALKDALTEQGIRVAQINVSAGLDQRQQEHAQQQNIFSQFELAKQQQNQSGRQGRDSGSSGGAGVEEGVEVYRMDAIRARVNVPSGLDLFA